jgi:hypothetical protein
MSERVFGRRGNELCPRNEKVIIIKIASLNSLPHKKVADSINEYGCRIHNNGARTLEIITIVQHTGILALLLHQS